MKAFAALLDGLVYMPSRNGKLRLMQDYFQRIPDPDRGWALAALAGTLELPAAKPAALRALIASRVDPVLFALSYDYVGDLAETCALLWPGTAAAAPPRLDDVVETLRTTHRDDVPDQLALWLDALEPAQRWALLKLITGGLRVGVSARLARVALAAGHAVDHPIGLADIEELWHALPPPYTPLFAWIEGRGERPDTASRPVFPPVHAGPAIARSRRYRPGRLSGRMEVGRCPRPTVQPRRQPAALFALRRRHQRRLSRRADGNQRQRRRRRRIVGAPARRRGGAVQTTCSSA